MIGSLRSTARKANERFRDATNRAAKSNVAMLKKWGIEHGIVLIGGTTSTHFQTRVAQRHLRHDLSPSHWSQVGLLTRGSKVHTVALHSLGDVRDFAQNNGVRALQLKEFDNAEAFPNFAVIQFTASSRALPKTSVVGRNQLDVPALALAWLGYLWAVPGHANPLGLDLPEPSAAMIEEACTAVGLDVTPGLTSAAACPEAIWQAAKWWHGYYEQADEDPELSSAAAIVPEGYYVVRQPDLGWRE